MTNSSILFLLMVFFALGAQLVLAWLLLAVRRRVGARRGPLAMMTLAALGSSVLTAWLLYHRLPEQLPVCTDSVLAYLHCLGL